VSGDLLWNFAALRPLRRKLELLGGLDVRRLLDVLGSELENQTRRRISEEKTSPDGEPWQEWSDDYAARRPSKGGLLELRGDLLDSITYEVGNDAVTVGSKMLYAAIHQDGSVYGPLQKGQGRIPARPFLGVSTENLEDLGALTIEFIAREFGR